jgi:nucleoside-diphosphate-sugar epimerase
MGYLVTGANGFIGSNIVERLAREGERVIALDRSEPTKRHQAVFGELSGKVEFILADVCDHRNLFEVIMDLDVERVIHAAVVTSDDEREKQSAPEIVEANLVGAAAAAHAAAEAELARFVLVGSVGVYGGEDEPDGTVLTELHPHRPANLYAISKSAAESIVARICTLRGLSWVIGRVGIAYGPWERTTGFRDTLSPILQLTMLASRGGHAILPHDRVCNWHYARDAAASLVALARARELGHSDYNLGPKVSWPLSDWCSQLARRFPQFTYALSTPEQAPNVNVYATTNGGRLSGTQYENEIGPTAHYDIDAAFSDYIAWWQADACLHEPTKWR